MNTSSWKAYRRDAAEVHTWLGVLLGGLMFAIFWMGTLSVYDRELDRWMMPATRLAPLSKPLSLDGMVPKLEALVPAGAKQWRIDLPTRRTPVVRLSYQTADGKSARMYLAPEDFSVIPDVGTLGASGFIFPFHYSLHIDWMGLGKWLAGTAGMAMLVLLVTGVVIHRKLLADFFTFRPTKRLPRSSLDLHNVTGVIGLPFHVAIVLSGLVIFFSVYFPSAHEAVFGAGAKGRAEFQAQSFGKYRPKQAADVMRVAAPLASLDAMVSHARQRWDGTDPYFIRVWQPSNAARYVELRRSYAGEVTMNLDQLYFDAATGEELNAFEAAPVMRIQRFISGMHFIQFDRPLLRFLYFVLGLSGCVMVATGLIYWLESRRAQKKTGVFWRFIEGTSVACTAGLIVATLCFLIANRVLPQQGLGADQRASLECLVFWTVWALCAVNGVLAGSRAWFWQAGCVAVFALLAVAANAFTTEAYHSVQAISSAVLGVDVGLLLLAAAGMFAAYRLKAGMAQRRK